MFDIDKMYGFFYNGKGVSSMNTKRGRDNLKLDMLLGIWRNSPHTTKQFLNPGNYDTLTEISEDVKKKRGIDEAGMKIFSPRTWIKTAYRMITGKALKKYLILLLISLVK